MKSESASAGPAPEARFDGLIAAVLRGEQVPWPDAWRGRGEEVQFVDRTVYHGVAGLLAEAQSALASWPETVLASLKAQAVGQLVWEIRHRQVLGELLAALADAGIPALVLKGSAIAYDLYDRPATRARGDTDLLVETSRLADARRVVEIPGTVYLTLGIDPSFGSVSHLVGRKCYGDSLLNPLLPPRHCPCLMAECLTAL